VKARVPRFPLVRVKALVAAGSFVVQESRAQAFHETYRQAALAVREVCSQITERQFARTESLTWDEADVYGVWYRQRGWYLKLTIDESIPELAIISFHPLQRPLRTNAGVMNP
jgi:Motility quorum-sensing regulator, toxin of MqsA